MVSNVIRMLIPGPGVVGWWPPTRLPDRRLQVYTWPLPDTRAEVSLFCHSQALHLTGSLLFEAFSLKSGLY